MISRASAKATAIVAVAGALAACVPHYRSKEAGNALIGGRKEGGCVTACRQPGSWKMRETT